MVKLARLVMVRKSIQECWSYWESTKNQALTVSSFVNKCLNYLSTVVIKHHDQCNL